MLSKKEQELYDAGMVIIKLASTARSLVRKKVLSAQARTITNQLGKAIDDWLAKQSDHTIYGSLPASRQSFKARKPADLDIAVDDPTKAATEIVAIFKKKYKKPINVVSSPGGNRYGVQVKVGNKWVDAVDIHKSGMFYQKYDVFGETLDPYKQNRLKIQRLCDQLLRKANSIMKHNAFTGFGPLQERALKDTVDFINIARTLIESKEVRQLADIERKKNVKKAQKIITEIKKAKVALKIWELHTRKIKDYGKKYKIYRDAIPDDRERKFIAHAKKHPRTPVKDMVFTNGKIEIIKFKPVKVKKKRTKQVFDYYDDPHRLF
jgi:hypothetical protein